MTGKLIGIGGKLASGKDTVGDFLVESHDWVKLNMSAPLLDMLLVLDPLVPAESEHAARIATEKSMSLPPVVHVTELYESLDRDYTELKTNREVRRLLQTLGTDVGRNMIDPNLWVNIASKNISQFRQQGKNVVITGIRFPNEFTMIHENRDLDGNGGPGTLVWVDRPGLAANSTVNAHASESLTSEGFDITIVNDGTLEDLYKKAEELL